MADRSAQAALTLRSPLVTVAAPVLFVVFGLFVPAALALGESVTLTIAFSLLVAAVGVGVYLIGRRLTRERISGAAARIREFVGVVLAAGLIEWPLLGVPLRGLVERPLFWIGEAGALLAWTFIALFERQLGRREFFLGAVLRGVEGRPGHEGGTVMAVARDFGIEAGEAEEGMKRTRRWLVFFLVWLLGLLVVTAWGMHAAPAAEQALVAASAGVVLLAIISLGRMREEQTLVMEGLLPSHRGASLSLALSLLLFFVCAAAAAVLASRPAAISSSTLAAIGAWIAWLFSLIPSPKHRAAPPPHPAPHFVLSRPPILNRFEKLPHVQTSELLHEILVYLGWTLLAVIVAAFLWMLLSPLFRLRYRRGGARSMFRDALRAVVSSFAGVVRRLREAISSVGGLHGEPGPEEADAEAGAQRQRRGTRRRRGGLLGALFGAPDRRFARAFLRLARWGEAHGVSFSRSLGPLEYAELVGARVPAVSGELAEVAGLYERHLFSPRALSPGELTVYFRKISEVVHHGG